MKTIIYTRAYGTATAGGADFQRNSQIQACSAAGILAGLPSRRDGDGEPKLLNVAIMQEPLSGSDKVFRSVVESLQPSDCLIVASLGVLGDTPSRLIASYARAIASGARILLADFPNADIQTVRQVAMVFAPLETKTEQLQAEIDSYYAHRHEERKMYESSVRHQVLDLLLKQGIDLTAMLPPPPGQQQKAPEDPVRGRHLRALREGLQINAEEAGKLLEAIGEKPLGKAMVSAIEVGRDCGPRMDAYELALRAEIGRRKRDQALDRQIAKSLNGAGPPLTATEREHVERVMGNGG